MKQIQTIEKGANFSAANFGQPRRHQGITFSSSVRKSRFREKCSEVRLSARLGGEFSFQVFAPGQETGFLHTHKNHEELYFFLSGKGEFQVDGEIFPVQEGSVVRVAPAGSRSVRNNGTQPLVMLCVQYRGNTFTAEDATDGNILNESVKW